MFSHTKPTPQLWVRSTHSSMSVKEEHKRNDSSSLVNSVVNLLLTL